MSLFTSADAAAVWGTDAVPQPTTLGAPYGHPAGLASMPPHPIMMPQVAPTSRSVDAPAGRSNSWDQPQPFQGVHVSFFAPNFNNNNNNNTPFAAYAQVNNGTPLQTLPSSHYPAGTTSHHPHHHPHPQQQQQLMYPTQQHQQQQQQQPFAGSYAAGPAMTFLQLPNGQIVVAQPQQQQWAPHAGSQGQYFPQQQGGAPGFAQHPEWTAPSSQGRKPALRSPAPQHQRTNVVVGNTNGRGPTPRAAAPQTQSSLPPAPAAAEDNVPRAFSANGARSSLVAPSVEPLRSLVADLSAGLEMRDVTTVGTAPTPIDAARLDTLVALTYKSFATDRDLMVFVKEHFGMELCLQIRDRICGLHEAAIKAAEEDETSDAYLKTTLATDMIERRGVLVVSLVEVLCTMPTPCSNEEQFAWASEPEKNLTSFCPLTRCVFMSLFDACVRSPRGCIALLRLFSSTSTAPRPVDNMVRQVTARLETLVFDAHANYLVSHILCTCELSTAEPTARVFEPIPRDEMLARTPTILALAAVNANKQQQQQGSGSSAAAAAAPPTPALPPRRIATASPAVWAAFIERLTEVLAADVVRTGTHREASHILEHTIRRADYKRIPGAARVISSVAADAEATLLPLAQSTCGRHCVRAVAETLATRGGDVSFDVLSAALTQLRLLQARIHANPQLANGFETVDAALRRIPEL